MLDLRWILANREEMERCLRNRRMLELMHEVGEEVF